MRLLAARSVPFVAGLRDIRRIGPALVAGLIGIASLLVVLGTHALAPRGAGEDAQKQVQADAVPGGETVVSKFARAVPEEPGKSLIAQPTSASRLLAMALAPTPVTEPPRSVEPNLAGLSEIPRELIWNRPPDKEDKTRPKGFAAFSKARENLPWDAVEPVPFEPLRPRTEPHAAAASGKTANVSREPLDLPDGGQVETWLKTSVREIQGADRGRPLHHFEFWLEPPAEVKRRLVGVSYEFNTLAIRPQSQTSSDQASGFRISAGGLACADKITLTLRFDDGRSQRVSLDGCKLFS